MESKSILLSVKQMLSIPEENTDFDAELITYINSALAYLWDLGIGPENGHSISSDKDEWDGMYHNIILNDVKELVYLRVKTVFDPPQVAALNNAYNERMSEVEWRVTNKKELLP